MKTLLELDMNYSSDNHINMLDLPDEILFLILRKLQMVDVLYSLANTHQRFRRLASDPLYINDLDMTNVMKITSLYQNISSIDIHVLSNICQNILPLIHHKVSKLTVEQCSIKSILHAMGDSPKLYSLSLLNFQGDILQQSLAGIVFNAIALPQQKKQSYHM